MSVKVMVCTRCLLREESVRTTERNGSLTDIGLATIYREADGTTIVVPHKDHCHQLELLVRTAVAEGRTLPFVL